MRPQGFGTFIRQEGYHALFLAADDGNGRIAIHKAAEPKQYFAQLRTKNPALLRLHRTWWLAGRPITSRIARRFGEQFAGRRAADGWFAIPVPDAERFVDGAIEAIGTWSASEAEMIHRLDQRERRRFGLSQHAPSPLRGVTTPHHPASQHQSRAMGAGETLIAA